MKVLITGMAGFIGSNLAKHLSSKKIGVIGIDNFHPYYDTRIKKHNLEKVQKNSLVEFIEGDINDQTTFQKLKGKNITHIVHLAARAGVRNSSEEAKEYLKTNIIGTLNVLEFAKEIKAKKVVLASTSSVYGKNQVPFNEEMNTNTPMSIYAASKIGMEALANAFNHLYGLPIIITRFFTVYGPGGRPDMAVYTFVEKILKGKEIEVYGNGDEKRDFTYVEDICEGIFLALQTKKTYGIYNLGNSESRTINELISIIEKNLGKKAKIQYVGKKKEDVEITLADISKAKAELGYSPNTRLEEGITKFIE
ncbi:MAG: SDR family NAD(P)-dependent oxidoreductase, partial [Candidatus Diapherotrites archaeon]